MQVELSNLHKDLGLTFILVTHDQEALSLSDRIAVMNQGKIEQVGSPWTPFVADFIGIPTYFRSAKAQASDYYRNRTEKWCNSLWLF